MADILPGREQHPTAVGSFDPLLSTKLLVPLSPSGLVTRNRLVERLDEARQHALTLISAPAGFGKTTLLVEWCAGLVDSGLAVAWLSLDENDSDLVRFWTYVMGALDCVQVDLSQSARTFLHSVQPAPIELTLTRLVNTIASLPFEIVLVLDDYHLIDSLAVHQTLEFLLDHIPQQLHLVIASRVDLPLTLARLRASRQLGELRTADLCFTPEEAAQFLTECMRLDLSPDDITSLETRTEGWIAGLQLAALSMRGREDIHNFIVTFTGSHRYILDYLLEEVVGRQAHEVQSFLLDTCILDRMAAPLCNAVTGRDDGWAMLRQLEHENMFLVVLDEPHGWYRYHQLFAEVLRTQLYQTDSVQARQLCSRAAQWHAQNGSRDEAVYYALAAQDYDLASQLIEYAGEEMLLRGQGARLHPWLQRLPEAYLRTRPQLGFLDAWALLFSGQLGAVETRLREVESSTTSVESRNNQTGGYFNLKRDLIGGIALARAAVAAVQSDGQRTVEMCQQALVHLSEDSLILRGLAIGYLGSAYWLLGNVTAASEAINEAISLAERAENTFYALTITCLQGQLYLAQGRLYHAAAVYERVLDQAARECGAEFPSIAPAHRGLSELYLEWNNLQRATQHAERAIDLGKQGGEPGALISGYLALARVRCADGDRDQTLAMIAEAEQIVLQSKLPPYSIGAIAAWRVQCALRWEDIESAVTWAAHPRSAAENVPAWLQDMKSTSQARILMAKGQLSQARQVLQNLRLSAESGGRKSTTIECLALEALVLQAAGSGTDALRYLSLALSLAEPEGYIRVFCNEGSAMACLLTTYLSKQHRDAAGQAVSRAYVHALLAVLSQNENSTAAGEPSLPHVYHSTGWSVISLTARELEVLRLIAGGASNRDIASELVVSLGTVKKHLNNIFAKLDAHSRTQAVAQAREFGVLPR